jgi:hypothetical protein
MEPETIKEAERKAEVRQASKKTFSERYFESLDKMEKTLGEAREVLRSVDLYQFLQDEREERERLRERVATLERQVKSLRVKKDGGNSEGSTTEE